MNAIKQPERFVNTLYTADNLYVLAGFNSQSVDLIYLDPPFNTKRFYSAPIGSRAAGVGFKDIWHWEDVDEGYLEELFTHYPALAHYIDAVGDLHGEGMMAYLTFMAQRLIEMHRVLKDTGSLYLHCDPTAGHYIKGLLDGVFGRRNFVNEIVWCYSSGGRSKTAFARKHDIILYYRKDNRKGAFTFNVQKVQLSDEEIRRNYPLVDAEGRHYRMFSNEKAGLVNYIQYAEKFREDWWADINILQAKEKERVGYPTQKPLKLLRRIVESSSNPGDIVLDPFCGCATTCVAAQQLGRKWLGIDIEDKAVDILIERLEQDNDKAGWWKDVFVHTAILPQRTDVENISPTAPTVKERLYKDQDGICQGCLKRFDLVNMEIDHIRPKSKGGGDYYENYQLLCGNCNRTKGDHTMAYLRAALAAREKKRTQISYGR